MKKPSPIYQLKVTLAESKPPIWRRILVASDMDLGLFHNILQDVMGWTDNHLHQFTVRGVTYSAPYEDMAHGFEMDFKDESKYKLSQLLKKEKASLTYEYDFGDSWQHKIVLEKILPHDDSMMIPSCIKGKRACPPEDCGGVWGYENLIAIIQDPKHPEYQDMREWLEEDFDPERFDLDEINDALEAYRKPRS
ncbi:MAG: plasmid pRiA4b ORF-3 family protein [Candidatus Contendobacter sp.]|nr:MAG: plasmid pRiA4b ORF-3 family protein [Candidatus Contendobacter sp.]